MRNFSFITHVLKTLLFFVILQLPFGIVVAQTAEDIYYGEFSKYRTTNFDSAAYYAQIGIQKSKEEGDSVLLAKFYQGSGWLKKETEDHEGAIEDFVTAYDISVAIGDEKRQKFILNFLGITFNLIGDYEGALKYHLKSLELAENQGNTKDIAIARNNIGVVYNELRHHKVALENFVKAYEYWKEEGNKSEIQRTAINIGNCYVDMEAYDQALIYFAEVKDETIIEPELKLDLNIALGMSNLHKENLEGAEGYLEKAESLALELDDFTNLTAIYYYRAIINLQQENYTSAKEFVDLSLNYAPTLPRWQSENYKIAAEIEEKLGNFKEANLYIQKYLAIYDSLLSEDVVQGVQDLRLAHETDKFQSSLEQKQREIEQNKKINILLAALLIALGLMAFLIYRASKVRKEAVQKIGYAYQMVEKQKGQLEKIVEDRTEELRTTNEELENFIYRTSHDIRGPLATLKGVCNVALLDVKDNVAVDYLRKIDTTSTKLINILSRIQNVSSISNYAPQQFDIELNSFVEDIITGVGLVEEVSVYINIPKGVSLISDPSMLKMTLSNVINNAFKFRKRQVSYSERPFVKISYEKKGDEHVIEITDNGIGIAPDNINKVFNLFFKNDPVGNNGESAGIGLHLSKLAIQKLGGSIAVNSEPGKLTIFTIKLPVIVDIENEMDIKKVESSPLIS